MVDANLFAWMALFIWPVVAVILFRFLSLPMALCATIIGGYLLLPGRIEIDLPLFPAINKHTIPALCALILTALAARQPSQNWPTQPGWLPKSLVVRIFLSLLVIGAVGTALTNDYALHYGETVIPRLKVYDAFSMLMAISMSLVVFLLGRKALASSEGQNILLIVLVVSAAVYAFLAIYEVRMSPQLNKIFYGFFPHSWIQHVRDGGFRPLVFLNHGLWLGLYFGLATLAAAGLLRIEKTSLRGVWALVCLFLLGTLFLVKTLGALLITLCILPIVVLFPKRVQVLIAATIAATALLYPAVRTANLIPLDSVVSLAGKLNPDRAQSLQYRLDNEEILLDKTKQKQIFGWGGWGRSRVFDEHGNEVSTTDGFWIITLGYGGWVWYVGVFGLLSWGVLALLSQRADLLQGPTEILALVMAASLVDLIPNATITPITWLIAGALAGGLEQRARGNGILTKDLAKIDRSGDVGRAPALSKTSFYRRQEQSAYRRSTAVKSQSYQSATTPETRTGLGEPTYRREFPKRDIVHDKKS